MHGDTHWDLDISICLVSHLLRVSTATRLNGCSRPLEAGARDVLHQVIRPCVLRFNDHSHKLQVLE
jgi:hypothetical protein